jgi:hypothetical protein
MYISIFKHFFNDFPSIVVSLKKSKAEALILEGVEGGFWKIFKEGEIFLWFFLLERD